MKQNRRFKVIECSGSHFEIGFQIGKECRENITHALAMTIGGLGMVHQANQADITANAMKFLPQITDFNPDLIERLQGLAAGAGISFEEAVTLLCAFDLGGYYGQLSSMCTSFAVTGSATVNGKTILGQTIDWFPGCPMDLIKVRQPNGVKRLSLVLWGVVEYTLNSNGFGMCANGTWAAIEKYLFNLPVSVYLQKAMSQDTIEEAMDILKVHVRGLGYYHLASVDNKMFGIEGIQDDFEIINPERDILVHSNHYLTERFKKDDMVNLVVPDSFDRVERIQALVNEKYGRIDPDTMMAIMSDHEKYPNSICRHVDPNKPMEMASETLAAYIMVPADGVMYISWGNPCQYEFEEYLL